MPPTSGMESLESGCWVWEFFCPLENLHLQQQDYFSSFHAFELSSHVKEREKNQRISSFQDGPKESSEQAWHPSWIIKQPRYIGEAVISSETMSSTPRQPQQGWRWNQEEDEEVEIIQVLGFWELKIADETRPVAIQETLRRCILHRCSTEEDTIQITELHEAHEQFGCKEGELPVAGKSTDYNTW